jgi:N-acetyl-gamma-glutamyl-phosphate reductase
VTPYGVAGHRHVTEIDQELAFLGAPIRATFVPHLVPLDQGELVSCYCTLRKAVDVDALFAHAYANEPFVEMTDRPPGVSDVRDTNFCRIHARFDERTQKVFVFAAIDNLWKGAASQAMQNLNLMFDVEETVGLL